MNLHQSKYVGGLFWGLLLLLLTAPPAKAQVEIIEGTVASGDFVLGEGRVDYKFVIQGARTGGSQAEARVAPYYYIIFATGLDMYGNTFFQPLEQGQTNELFGRVTGEGSAAATTQTFEGSWTSSDVSLVNYFPLRPRSPQKFTSHRIILRLYGDGNVASRGPQTDAEFVNPAQARAEGEIYWYVPDSLGPDLEIKGVTYNAGTYQGGDIIRMTTTVANIRFPLAAERGDIYKIHNMLSENALVDWSPPPDPNSPPDQVVDPERDDFLLSEITMGGDRPVISAYDLTPIVPNASSIVRTVQVADTPGRLPNYGIEIPNNDPTQQPFVPGQQFFESTIRIYKPQPDDGWFDVGETVSVTVEVKVPQNYAGSYFVASRVDPDNKIPEPVNVRGFNSNIYAEITPGQKDNNTFVSSASDKITIQGPTPSPSVEAVSAIAFEDGRYVQGGGQTSDQSVASADGNVIAFSSSARNLLIPPQQADAFIRSKGRKADMSLAANYPVGSGQNIVNFETIQPFLTTGQQIFRRLRQTRETYLVSGLAGVQANADCFNPAMNSGSTNNVPGITTQPGGRYIAYDSRASNLGVANTGNRSWIYVTDTSNGNIVVISRASGTGTGDTAALGALANGDCFNPAISANGRFVAFESVARNLTSPALPENTPTQIYLHDRDVDANGQFDEPGEGKTATYLVSVDTSGNPAARGTSVSAAVNATESNAQMFVAFQSTASSLTSASDSGQVYRITVNVSGADRGPVPSSLQLVSQNTNGQPSQRYGTAPNNSIEPSISGDGSQVAFSSSADNLVYNTRTGTWNGDTNKVPDVFVRNFAVPSSDPEYLRRGLVRVSESIPRVATGVIFFAGPALDVFSISVLNQGSGYTTPPAVTIEAPDAGGIQATAVAVLGTGVDAGRVIRVDITNYGTLYSRSRPPAVTLSGGGGTGATAAAVWNPSRVNIPQNNPQTGDSLQITSGGVTKSFVFVRPAVAGIVLVNGGGGYTSTPTVTIDPPGGGGATAVATAILGTGANAGRVVGFNVTNPGSGYTAVPRVRITGGGGSGALATAVLGQPAPTSVGLITITSPGTAYSSDPEVNIAPPTTPGGTQAQGRAVLGTGSNQGQVVRVEITNGGSGYTTEPLVTITGGGGTGATATAVLATVNPLLGDDVPVPFEAPVGVLVGDDICATRDSLVDAINAATGLQIKAYATTPTATAGQVPPNMAINASIYLHSEVRGEDGNGTITFIPVVPTPQGVTPVVVDTDLTGGGVQAEDAALAVQGVPAGSNQPSISEDGRVVAFRSIAGNLDVNAMPLNEMFPAFPPYQPGPIEGELIRPDLFPAANIYVRNRQVDTGMSDGFDQPGNVSTTRVSFNRFGYPTTADLLGLGLGARTTAANQSPFVAGNGRFISFSSGAEIYGGLVFGRNNLEPLDFQNARDVYVFDSQRVGVDPPSSDSRPEVALTSPAANLTFLTGSTISLGATAVPKLGKTITSVQFYVNGSPVGPAFSAEPYATTYRMANPGQYTVRVVATDSRGVTSAATALVNAAAPGTGDAPGIVVVHPVPAGGTDTGNDFSRPSELYLNAVVTGAQTTNTPKFFANGQQIAGSVTSLSNTTGTTYGIRWSPTSNGRYEITAQITGNTSTNTNNPSPAITAVSDALEFAIGEVSRPLPTISLLELAQTNVRLGSTLTFQAEVGTDLTPVDRVDFYANQVLIGSAVPPVVANGRASVTFTWQPPSTNTYAISARAQQVLAGPLFDNSVISTGSTTNTNDFIVKVDENSNNLIAPTVVLAQQPIADANYVEGSSLFFNASVTPAGDSVITNPNAVNFYFDGAQLEGSFTGLEQGKTRTYATQQNIVSGSPSRPLFATAIDNQSLVGSSATRNLTVVTPLFPLPTVEMLPLLPGVPLDASGTVTLRARAVFPSTANQESRVEFYANGGFIGIGTVDPADPTLYTLVWKTPAAASAFAIKARAVALNWQTNTGNDNRIKYYGSIISANATDLNTISGTAPEVTITAPANGSTNLVNTDVLVTASAFVPGGLNSVVSNAVVGPIGTYGVVTNFYPTALPGSFVTNGQPLIDLQAFPGGGSTNLRAPVAGKIKAYTVTNGANVFPGATVAEIYPATNIATPSGAAGAVVGPLPVVGQSVLSNQELVSYTTNGVTSIIKSPVAGQITAVASNLVVGQPLPNTNRLVTIVQSGTGGGIIQRVEFFANGNQIGTSTNAPYSTTYRPLSAGRYSLYAVAYSQAGLLATSDPVVLNASLGVPPASFLTTLNSARATARTNAGAVVGFTNLFGGSGYTNSAVPAVRIVGGTTGVAATATARVGVSGSVTGLTNLVGGSGYTNVPTVVIDPPPVAVGSNSTVLLQATASDTDGTIRQVDFLQNGVVVGTATNQPFNFNLPVSAPGRYELIARATDNLGNVTDSPYIVLSGVNGTPPTASFTIPRTTTVQPVPVANPDLTVRTVSGNLVFSFLRLQGVTYTVQERASLSTGTWTPKTDVVIVRAATQPSGLPEGYEQAEFTVPVVGSSGFYRLVYAASTGSDPNQVNLNETLTINASADASSGGVALVELLVNGQVVEQRLSGPYNFTRQMTNSGRYDFAVRVTDTLGNVTTSAGQSVTVAPGISPTVSITSPNDGLKTPLVPVNVFWSASDADGSVVLTQLLVNGAPVYTANLGSGNFTYNFPSEGLFSLVVRATDNLGNVTDSAPVTVSVDNTFVDPTPRVALDPRTLSDQGYVIGSILYFNATAIPRGSNTIVTNSVQFTLGTQPPLPGSPSKILFGTNEVFAAAPQEVTSGTPNNVRAQAKDSAGNVGISDPQTFYYANSFSPLPSVDMLTRAPGEQEAAGGVVQLRAKAFLPVSRYNSGTNARDSRVEFYANGALLGSAQVNTNPTTTNSFTHFLNWTTPTNTNSYRIEARVVQLNFVTPSVDANGNQIAETPYFGASISPAPRIVNLSTNTSPTITITNPSTNGSQVGVGITNQIVASITTATNASVKEVQWYVDGLFVTNNTGFPYIYNFAPTNTGLYNIAAVVVDSFGLQGSSTVRTVSAISGAPPTVTLAGPGFAVIGQTNRLVATPVVTQSGRNIEQVEFLVNGRGVQTLTAANENSSYVYNWPVTAPGIYEVQARATDNVGNVAVSNLLELVTRNAPNVTLSAPTTATTGQAVTMSATVSNTGGTGISAVEFLVDGVVIATDTTAPYLATYTPMVAGTYQLQARALTVDGVTGFSNIVPLTAIAPDPANPTVTIEEPLAGVSQLLNVPINVRAVALPGPGATVSSVTLSYTDPDNLTFTLPATQSGSAYSSSFVPTKAGNYTVRAVVTDSNNRTANSSVLVVVQQTTVNPASNTAFIYDMYAKILAKVPTPTELSAAESALAGPPPLSRADFVYNLLQRQDYMDVQNRAADFYFTLGVAPTRSAFLARVAEIRANTNSLTAFNNYATALPWNPPPPFGATVGQMVAAQSIYDLAQPLYSLTGDDPSYVRWLFNRLGDEVGSLQQVVSLMASYGTQARGAAAALLTASFNALGTVSPQMAEAQTAYQNQLKATTVRFLLGGPWEATSLPTGLMADPVARLSHLEVSTEDSLRRFIGRLLADTSVVLVAPGRSASASGTSTFGGGAGSTFTLTANGSGYSNSPAPLVILAPPRPSTAKGTATITNGALASINLTGSFNGFYGTDDIPRVFIGPAGFGGLNAGARARIASSGSLNGRVTNIQVTNAGSGYGSTTWVYVNPPIAQEQATAQARVSPAGLITNVTLSRSGSGYTTNSLQVLIGAPPRFGSVAPGSTTNVFSAAALTNSSLVNIGSFQLLLNSVPVATNTASNNMPTASFSFTAPTNVGTNTISVRSISPDGFTIGESSWSSLIVE